MLIALFLVAAIGCQVLLASLLVPAIHSLNVDYSRNRGAILLLSLFLLAAWVGKYALIFYAGMLAGGGA